jgi:hypothetical protein
MKRYLPGSTVAAVLLAAALFASATGGAVAGSVITGKQIKDGSLTGKDVKEKSLQSGDLSDAAAASLRGQAGAPGTPGTPGLSGVEYVHAEKPVPIGGNGAFLLDCPPGKTLLSVAGQWENDYEPVQMAIGPTLVRAIAFYNNQSGSPNELDVQAICAKTS